MQLIEQIAADEFHPEAYEDSVRKRTRELIENKVQGQEIKAAPPEAPRAQIIDLMEALKASLSAAQPAAKSAEPIPIASRKPPKAAPRTASTGAAETKKKTSKR
jgi:DNA end-binding protein Ku